MKKTSAAQASRRKTNKEADYGGIGLLPGNYLLIARKGKRALAAALGRLPKERVIKTTSNAPAKNRRAGADSR